MTRDRLMSNTHLFTSSQIQRARTGVLTERALEFPQPPNKTNESVA